MGTFLGHAKGFGFVRVEGYAEDFFVPANKVMGAFHLDQVAIRELGQGELERGGRRREARVERILSRGIQQAVGTFWPVKGSYAFVVPDNKNLHEDIYISREHFGGAAGGDKVLVRLTGYGTDRKSPEGAVIEVLGEEGAPGVDMLSILRGHGLEISFPPRVLAEAAKWGENVKDKDALGRKDLRRAFTITIDGEDAKDLDDALSIEKDGEEYVLTVHIADVAHYVPEDGPLDREAVKRGTSVYMPDRVLPMLPPQLSNGLCSLNAGEDRLALSVQISVDASGEVVDYSLSESIIRVDRRVSYSYVAAVLAGEEAADAVLRETLAMLDALAQLLGRKRQKRGSIDFEFPECKIQLDEKGQPVDIQPYLPNRATRLIEECMLLANETVAQHFYWLDIPFVYRSHPAPDAESIAKLSAFISNMGYYLQVKDQAGRHAPRRKGGEGGERPASGIHPKELQKLLDKVAGKGEEALISRMTLRSMKKAYYSTDHPGHFGLACQYYCHFTSPIRRYPDLQIHRIIKEYLARRLDGDRKRHYGDILEQRAATSSAAERRAQEVEREAVKRKKAQYMAKRIGCSYEGVVSSVTPWGMYVELPNTVEGLVHIFSLPGDDYAYAEESLELVGKRTGRVYALGQPVGVRVLSVDVAAATVDFVLEEEDGQEGGFAADSQ